MKLCSIIIDNTRQTAFYFDNGIVSLSSLKAIEGIQSYWQDMKHLITDLDRFKLWYLEHKEIISSVERITLENVQFGPLIHDPSKIWGIGLNYRDHAKDLDETTPELYPASFNKPPNTIIGHEDTIYVPKLSNKTTGEAELGIIIGKGGKNITEENWMDHVAGFTTIIDVTAEDILRHNPRYLTLSKSFDSFLSIGPVLITVDEFNPDNIEDLQVSTILNDKVIASNLVKNMTFSPAHLVSFHSKVMPLNPGDIISTGTPRAVVLSHGDVITCRITDFPVLKNPVVDLKVT